MGSINPNIPSPILSGAAFEKPAVKAAIEKIEKTAEDLIAVQGGLSKKDIEMLNAMAAPLLSFPILTAPDRTAMSNWLAKLATYEKTDLSTLGALRRDVLIDKPPENNPYLEPGVMAMLAPILSELSIIMAEIMRQSSLLQQAMMDLTVAMAGEAFHQAIAAGDAKVHQLQMEIAQSVVACVTAAVGLGCTIALGGFTEKSIFEAKHNPTVNLQENKLADLQARQKSAQVPPGESLEVRNKPIDDRIAEKRDQIDKLENPSFVRQRLETQEVRDKQIAERKAEIADLEKAKISATNTRPNEPGLPVPTKDDIDKAQADLNAAKGTVSTDMQNINTRFQILTQVIQQSTQMVTMGSQAITTALKISSVLEEAMANAMKDMIGQLMQMVSTTMSSAQQSGQSADKEWEGINQLFRDFASTITRSIYQG